MVEFSERVLVIKLGAIGDFVQATGPFAAIRSHHPNAHLTLLTTYPLAQLATPNPWFDRVCSFGRPSMVLAEWIRLVRFLRDRRYDRVYDLQTSDRSCLYFHLMRLRIVRSRESFEWCGIAHGCSHRHRNSARDKMHTIDRHIDQLRVAGIHEVPLPSLDYVESAVPTSRFENLIGERYVLLVPGSAAHRLDKRWHLSNYGKLACSLVRRGVTPVILGSKAERELGLNIYDSFGEAQRDAGCNSRVTSGRQHDPVLDLTGRTNLSDIVGLARGAAGAVGSDTGPMHLIAVTGTPSVVLFSKASDPNLCAPRAPNVTILQRDELQHVAVREVEEALQLR